MYFTTKPRYNPKTQHDEEYLTLKESFRDKAGRVHNRTLLTVGFLEEHLRDEDVRDISKALTRRYENRAYPGDLFGDEGFGEWNETVMRYARQYWSRMVREKVIDTADEVRRKADEECRRMVRTETMRHTDARECGAEWLCLQAAEQLGLKGFLTGLGWSEAKVNAALSVLVARAVYSPSELKTRRLMEENSAVCELVRGDRQWLPSMRSIYGVAPSLYGVKEELERHLCEVTDNLFNQSNSIVLFDLTNFYLEGRKAASRKAKFGRSKEKRSDCRLLVLALCINTDGFIRYSSILEGNTADPKSLPAMVDGLLVKSPVGEKGRTLVVIDAGIATEENLALLKDKGYNYLCVSRTRLKDYDLAPGIRWVGNIRRVWKTERHEHPQGRGIRPTERHGTATGPGFCGLKSLYSMGLDCKSRPTARHEHPPGRNIRRFWTPLRPRYRKKNLILCPIILIDKIKTVS